MGEIGKRSRQDRDSNNEGKNQKKRPVNKENHDEGELVVYRILCPDNVIGGVIGKGGKVINSMRQESHARIKVVEPFPGADKRVITIYSYVKDKDPDDVDEDDVKPVCPAQDALLRVHYAIVNALANNDDSDKQRKQEAHLLVPASQAANVIGKAGATIKRIRSKTRANIRVSPKDPSELTHSCAMAFDNFVQITGDSEAVKKALFAVSAIMYKFSPREEISLETTVPELPPIIIPSDAPIYPAGSFYPGADATVPPRNLPPHVSATTTVPPLHGFVDNDSMWSMYSSALPVVSGYGGPSRSGELVVRVLCPSDKIGRVIGRGGSTIQNIRQASGARIEVDDKKHGAEECIITVTSTESVEDVKSAAVEAVLLLQNKISDEDDERVNMRLLIPKKVIGCLIGKNGSIVNEMRKKTKADIRISKGEKPKHASESDELVEVIGEVGNSRDALLQITLRLREDVLTDRNGSHTNPPLDSRYSSSLPVSSVVPSIPQAGSLGYNQRAEAERGLGMFPGSSLYGYSSFQAGDSAYNSLASYSLKGYTGLPEYTEMPIPGDAVGKVMGRGGANIGNICKISGAHVEIVDSKTSRSERVAQISGTADQKQAAKNLIQAFIMST